MSTKTVVIKISVKELINMMKHGMAPMSHHAAQNRTGKVRVSEIIRCMTKSTQWKEFQPYSFCQRFKMISCNRLTSNTVEWWFIFCAPFKLTAGQINWFEIIKFKRIVFTRNWRPPLLNPFITLHSTQKWNISENSRVTCSQPRWN